MFSQKNWIMFFAGAQAFHTLGHIIINRALILPIQFLGIDWTVQLNYSAIVINAVVTLALLWWASQLKGK